MNNMDKQSTGFRYGKYATKLIRICGHVTIDGREYKLVLLQTNQGQHYYAVRLYNPKGKFIKQLLFEPDALGPLRQLFEIEERGRHDTSRS